MDSIILAICLGSVLSVAVEEGWKAIRSNDITVRNFRYGLAFCSAVSIILALLFTQVFV